MKKALTPVVAAVFVLFLVGVIQASNVAQQTVTFEIQAINEISVSGNPGALVVNAATAGSQPDSDTDSSTTYAITTNCASNGKKITAAIGEDMPSGVTLSLTLSAPAGGISGGAKDLSTSAQDVVTAIDAVAQSGISISYQLSATVSAGVVASGTRTVTLTLADAS